MSGWGGGQNPWRLSSDVGGCSGGVSFNSGLHTFRGLEFRGLGFRV